MIFKFDKVVFGMALVRMLSSAIELTSALLMLKFNRVEIAFKINAMLAMVGPLIMLTVTMLGLVGLAGKISSTSLIFILTGVILIFIGLRGL